MNWMPTAARKTAGWITIAIMILLVAAGRGSLWTNLVLALLFGGVYRVIANSLASDSVPLFELSEPASDKPHGRVGSILVQASMGSVALLIWTAQFRSGG